MPLLNPFLRAFFRSTVPLQCAPIGQHILLVPTTEFLLDHRDAESGGWLPDIAANEDFLASHVLRISSPTGPDAGQKEHAGASIRDNRGKAKQFTTLNGRTVVIKDAFVYSNKGFRNLNQAQLISDTLYYHDGLEAQQWLIYYISRPLVGSPEPIERSIAVLPQPKQQGKDEEAAQNGTEADAGPSTANGKGKQDIKSFGDLLSKFPLIARQMYNGLDKVFKDFQKEAGRPLPVDQRQPSHSRSNSNSSVSGSAKSGGVGHKRRANGHKKTGSISSINTMRSTYADEEQDHMRKALEDAITTAIDLFQQVDKQQLSLLGATTDLTGPMVERLIEKHVAEQVHDSVLFPRLCDIHETEDVDLDSGIQRMYYVDIGQVGVDFEGGLQGKRELTRRLRAGIEEFRKMGVATSPQQMIETLLQTTKIVSGQEPDRKESPVDAEPKSPMTINADALVSLLLIVVIRSNVRHLQARLSYMRNFIFIDDVDSGEIGYALSTYEAVLAYLTTDSGGLRVASRRNRRLWQAIKRGNLSEMRTILEPDDGSLSDESDSMLSDPDDDEGPIITNGMVHDLLPEPEESVAGSSSFSQADTAIASRPSTSSNLSHVFPFQSNGWQNGSLEETHPPSIQNGFGHDYPLERPKIVKRVSWSRRSLSNVSEFSFGSRASTVASRASFIEGDTSIEKLCQTQDHSGNSLLMMAVRAQQPESLAYLLSLDEFFNHDDVLRDTDENGTTLLSAAIQSADPILMDVFVDFLFEVPDIEQVRSYAAQEDAHGRSMAHYLFHAPELMSRFATLLPWRKKDKNGQTPLLALCRSYDHPHYIQMVNEALQLAANDQGDGEPLHVDDHVDNKGNTLLHVVTDAVLALRILQHCDADPNAPNEKKFTPLMVASKFGRFDLVRALFLDQRVDPMAKEYRGMTAVELAKDDDVRNRIDDMVLVSNIPAADGKVTAVVRSFFMDDGSVRLVIKSASRHGDGMISVTTCRRSLSDFEHLAKWLSVEHPASWIPAIDGLRLPYQIPSRPSRTVLQDVHIKLDKFLRTLLEHPTFANHELLWEFILVPEIQPDMWAERSSKKAEIARENIREEYEPMTEFRDVETFVGHARESLRGLSQASRTVVRRTSTIRNIACDVCTALTLANGHVANLQFLPASHAKAFSKYVAAWAVGQSDPYTLLHASLLALHGTTAAMLAVLGRPLQHISTIQTLARAIDRQATSLRRAETRWQWGAAALLEESRSRTQEELRRRLEATKRDMLGEGSELRFTQQTVAAELAVWHVQHGKMARRALRKFGEGMVVRERERLEAMKRALRATRQA